jgi:phosphoribosylanthranilate isomerase
MAPLHVKICGLTTAEDVVACLDAGATALGFNLVAGTPRAVDPETARRLVAAAGGRAETVLVVADLAPSR